MNNKIIAIHKSTSLDENIENSDFVLKTPFDNSVSTDQNNLNKLDYTSLQPIFLTWLNGGFAMNELKDKAVCLGYEGCLLNQYSYESLNTSQNPIPIEFKDSPVFYYFFHNGFFHNVEQHAYGKGLFLWKRIKEGYEFFLFDNGSGIINSKKEPQADISQVFNYNKSYRGRVYSSYAKDFVSGNGIGMNHGAVHSNALRLISVTQDGIIRVVDKGNSQDMFQRKFDTIQTDFNIDDSTQFKTGLILHGVFPMDKKATHTQLSEPTTSNILGTLQLIKVNESRKNISTEKGEIEAKILLSKLIILLEETELDRNNFILTAGRLASIYELKIVNLSPESIQTFLERMTKRISISLLTTFFEADLVHEKMINEANFLLASLILFENTFFVESVEIFEKYISRFFEKHKGYNSQNMIEVYPFLENHLFLNYCRDFLRYFKYRILFESVNRDINKQEILYNLIRDQLENKLDETKETLFAKIKNDIIFKDFLNQIKNNGLYDGPLFDKIDQSLDGALSTNKKFIELLKTVGIDAPRVETFFSFSQNVSDEEILIKLTNDFCNLYIKLKEQWAVK